MVYAVEKLVLETSIESEETVDALWATIDK